MALRRPWWQRLVQRIAYSQPGVWFFSRTLHHIDKPLLRLSRGRLCVASLLAGIPVISLTTTGAKSGKLRTLPVLALSDGERYVVIASSWGRRSHPAWYYNLRAHPRATVSTPERTGAYVARESTVRSATCTGVALSRSIRASTCTSARRATGASGCLCWSRRAS